jgi:hypothetical protein
MQAELKRGKAASGVRRVGGSLAILAGVPLIATLALCAPDRAFAACGAGGPTGVHAAGGGSTSGVHAATAHASSGGGSGGGGGGGGCAGGASAPALRGLPTTASGRVVEAGAHAAAHTTTATRTAATRTAATRTAATATAATRTANTGAHLRASKGHHA